MIEEVLKWIASIPGLQGIVHDRLEAAPGSLAMNCMGQKVIWERYDILGVKTRRLQTQFAIGHHTTDMNDLELVILLNKKSVLELAPVFGMEQTVKVEQGHMEQDGIDGVLRMVALLTFEYTEEE